MFSKWTLLGNFFRKEFIEGLLYRSLVEGEYLDLWVADFVVGYALWLWAAGRYLLLFQNMEAVFSLLSQGIFNKGYPSVPGTRMYESDFLRGKRGTGNLISPASGLSKLIPWGAGQTHRGFVEPVTFGLDRPPF